MEMYFWTVWLAIFVIALIIEVSVSGLISIWISLAALITLPFSFIDGLPFWGEIIIFVALCLILLAATRPFVKKILNKREDIKTNVDSLVGRTFELIKDVEELSVGEVKINGVYWDCESIDNKKIEKGKKVKVIEIKGNKLIVEEVK